MNPALSKVSVGNLQLHVAEMGTGRPLLLVHGFPLDHSMWNGQIGALSGDCRVIAPDLRGFGQSSTSPASGDTTTMQQFADDLAGLLDALQIEEPVVFCGLSMGGYIAWQFFARHRDRLAGLIVCDSRAVADNEKAAAGRMENATKVEQLGPQMVADAMLPKLFPASAIERKAPFVEATKNVMLASPRIGVAAALRGMAKRPDFTGELAKIDVPTLIICGEEDAIAPVDEMRSIAEGIPNARFVAIPNAGHMAPLEKPDEVNTAIREFVQSLPK